MNKQSKRTWTLFAALLVGGGFVALTAQSADSNETSSPAPPAEEIFLDDLNLAQGSGLGLDSGRLFLKMMGSVVLVIVLGAAALYLSKKVLPKVTNAAGKEIRVVETTYLGPRKALHLVQVGNQKLLIGSTNENIATLAHVGEAWLDLSRQEMDQAVNA